jgi:hypothetical protein
MRALWVAAAVFAAVTAVEGCKSKKRQPIPGPRAHPTSLMATTGAGVLGTGATHMSDSREGAASHEQPGVAIGKRHEGAGGIAWFQGSVEEAFSRRVPR